jgi:ElaB/YqjD/DUF883 family membrane-anchored ribosome-binding protein
MSQTEMSPPGSSTSDQAKQQAQQVAERAQETAGKVADQAQMRVRDQIDQRSTDLGQQISATAKALRTSSSQLSQQGNTTVAQATDRAADQADQLGQYLRTADANRILGDAEQFGRENPWVVIAGGLVAGIAAARFLKASSRRRYETAYRPDAYAHGGPVR